MKLPLSWLKEYIHISCTPEEISKRLTMAGIEVDSIEKVPLPFKNVVVGHVLATEKHPNADKLCVARVTDGAHEYQVVCGAPNCRAGLKTAFAPVGAVLFDEQGKEFKIKQSKIRGVESSGMLCSSEELGLGLDNNGIIEFPDTVNEGAPVDDIFADQVFELSLTPNLGHCSSLIGVVRELSASTAEPFRLPKITVSESPELSIGDCAKVTILNKEHCPRYTCRVIKGVKIGPSPEWLKKRVEVCGIRSINNVVDVTNLVLLKWGTPYMRLMMTN